MEEEVAGHLESDGIMESDHPGLQSGGRELAPFTGAQEAARASYQLDYTFQDGNYGNSRIGNVQENRVELQQNYYHQYYTGMPMQQSSVESPRAEVMKPNELRLSEEIYLLKNERLIDSVTSRVHKGIQRSMVIGEKKIAIKMIGLIGDEKQDKRLIKEAKILEDLSHPNIVKMVATGMYEGDLGNFVYIAMELCQKQNLHDMIKKLKAAHSRLNEHSCQSYCSQICKGLRYLHKKGIIHGDLNPRNILLTLDNQHVKITDFGLSKSIYETHCSHKPRFRQDGWKPFDTSYTKSSEIYSLGLVFYFIWSTGMHVFGPDSASWNHYIRKKKMKGINLASAQLRLHELEHGIPLLRRMLEKDPDNRPSAKKVSRDAYFKIKIEENTTPTKEETVGAQKPIYSVTNTVIVLFDSRSRRVMKYNPGRNELKEILACTTEMNKRHLSAVSLGRSVYVFQNKLAWKFNLELRNPSWIKIKGMNENHGDSPPVAASGGFIYVAGGENVSALLTSSKQTCTRYDEKTNSWEKLSKLKSKRRSHAFIGSGGYLWCFGGRDGFRRLEDYERYDLNDGTKGNWIIFKSCPVSLLYSAAIAESNGQIYILGGSDGKNRVNIAYRFDTTINEWTLLRTRLQQPRACFRAHIINSALYVVGGNISTTGSSLEKIQVDKLDEEGQSFQKIRHDKFDNQQGLNIKGEGTVCVTFP